MGADARNKTADQALEVAADQTASSITGDRGWYPRNEISRVNDPALR
jgi:hypothetical protein